MSEVFWNRLLVPEGTANLFKSALVESSEPVCSEFQNKIYEIQTVMNHDSQAIHGLDIKLYGLSLTWQNMVKRGKHISGSMRIFLSSLMASISRKQLKIHMKRLKIITWGGVMITRHY